MRFISRFGRFHEDFTLRAFHSLYPFHLSIPFTSLSLSPLFPFHLSIPFTSLSLSPLSLSLSLSLSYLSLPLFISPSTFLSFSLLLSLFSLSFSLENLYPCFIYNRCYLMNSFFPAKMCIKSAPYLRRNFWHLFYI